MIPFALDTRSWKHDHVWKLCNKEPEWAKSNLAPIKHYGEDNAIVSTKMARTPSSTSTRRAPS